jgi:UTP--glucose-1-phosphate uridylyltransferase
MDRCLEVFSSKFDEYGISKLAQRIFYSNLKKIEMLEAGFILSESINPVLNVDSILTYNKPLEYNLDILDFLKKVVVVKLNGGLGTSMGMSGAKSQLEVKDGLNFIDICIKQIEVLRKISGVPIPLVFMNSFNTQYETEENLKRLNFKNESIPTFFIENKVPKIFKNQRDEYEPASYPQNPSLEWAPPGHADIYPAMFENGLLESLIKNGYEYIFVSNVDNLGATIDFEIIQKIKELKSSFVMEVAQRTENDKKGGHVALDISSNRYILRESAQVSKTDLEDFQNFKKYCFFNTNSIWINVKELMRILVSHDGNLNLPVIVNKKNVNPTDTDSTEIIQLESAMGSAISLFEDSKILLVPSERFIPVKNTSNLLFLRSDAVTIDSDFRLHPTPGIYIELSLKYYKNISDFEQKFKVIPSLKHAKTVKINSDKTFNHFEEITGIYEV